jgi:hypothetical protein
MHYLINYLLKTNSSTEEKKSKESQCKMGVWKHGCKGGAVKDK